MSAERITALRDELDRLRVLALAALEGCEMDDMEWDDGGYWQNQHGEAFGSHIAAASPALLRRLVNADLAEIDAHHAEEGVMVGCPEDATDEHYATCFGEHEITACYTCSPPTEDGQSGRAAWPCPFLLSRCSIWLGPTTGSPE